MNKYYITFGKQTLVTLASTPIQAAIIGFKRMITKFGSYMPKELVVSESGFDRKDTDDIYSVGEIIQIISKSNECEVEYE